MKKLTNIYGVGEKTFKHFKKLNIINTNDLLNYYPVKYDIFNETTSLSKENDQKYITIYCKISSDITVSKYTKTKFSKFTILYNNKNINVYAFNQLYLNQSYKKGDYIYLTAKYDYYKNSLTTSKITNKESFKNILPIYNIENLYDSNITKIIKEILKEKSYSNKEILPNYILNKYNLINNDLKYKYIHFPNNIDELKKALVKIKIEEAYKFQKAMIERINVKKMRKPININKEKINSFINKLPFKLTNDQLKAINESLDDFKKDYTVSRLIQGDVGSGKTIVSVVLIYQALISNLQVAFMAPTEILAKQHYNTLKTHFKDDFNIKLLTSNTLNKNALKNDLKNGKINLIVGTHALTTNDVLFNNLGLIIIDEQHKFGVGQRNDLIKKGNANLIYLTATPIPRTLAITMFINSNISIIKEKPKNRKKVITKSYHIKEIEEVLKKMEERLNNNEKVFVVAPAILSNHAKYNVENLYKAFKNRFNNKYPIFKMHGNMDDNLKEEILTKFKVNNNGILISTSMIEVGIDIKDATLMLIFASDHFGLSQLHQLRGRVGRGDKQSYCYLISDNPNERLEILEKEDDGFKISEYDLLYRGPGDFLGTYQKGNFNFKSLDFKKDYKLLKQIRTDILSNLK